ncbi:hypothetical protein ELG79_04955 [Rhizobium leguminosarum]|nr:hypothetical protein ELG79_04955 [Rhizobium leguminosarum]TBG41137.1 hypothetical protein ELG77_04940 [Rhizobium leguminosarum]
MERSPHIPFAPPAGRRWRQPDEGRGTAHRLCPRARRTHPCPDGEAKPNPTSSDPRTATL